MNSKKDNFLKPRVQVSYLKIQNVLKPLYEGLNFIGRRRDATVIIENQNVSQYHAVITITNDKHYVSDTGSFNGSFLDKDKLQPHLLYELTEGSIIHFACVTAIYVKTPSSSQVVCALQKNTQNLSESFFGGQTQQLEVQGVEEVFNNCFDDGYDFNDVVPIQHVDTVVSIHDMPTQIFSSSHLNIIENCSPSKTGPPSIHDLATQVNIQQDNSCSVHEMPTQIILSESNVENEISITTTNTHELATQFIDLEKSINLITAKKGKEIKMHELATQINSADDISIQKPQQDKEIEICNALNENEDASIKKNQEQNNLLNSDKNDDILCRPSTSKDFDNNTDRIIDDDCVIEPDHSMVNVSDDIIDDSFLGNVTEVGENQEYLLLKSINKLTNSEQIPSQTPFQASQPVGFSTIKKQSQPIVYSTSSSEKGNSPISEDLIVPGQTKNCLRINSDSDTDMEDLPSASNSKIKKDLKDNNQDDLGSATDIENNLNLIEVATTKKVVRRRKKCRKIDSDSETDVENSNIEKFDSDSDTDIEDVPKISTPSPNKMSLKKKDKDFNITNSDSDTDIEKNDMKKNIGLSNKITVREEQDSDIIPCTQLSDDDIDDFNFGIGKSTTVTTTVVEKNNMEDISENFSLRMSSYTELSEEINNAKKIDVSVPTNEIQLNIGADSLNNSKTDQLIIEKIQEVTRKSTPELPLALPTTSTLISDDSNAQLAPKIVPEKESLFMQPTQLINIEKESDNIFVSSVQKSSSSSKHIFNQPTQALPHDDYLFIQPTQEIIETSKGDVSTSKNVFDKQTELPVPDVNRDDLLMQPTQKIIETSKYRTQGEHLFIIPTGSAKKFRSSSENVFDRPSSPLVPNENCDDDLFMQPTQKLPQNSRSQESVFDHPTQRLSLDDKVDDFFLQPTQKIGDSSRPITFNEDKGDDLFLQPTQRIISISDKQKDKEDLFDQPTQVLTIEDGLNGNNENDCDDLFFQPTQKVVSTSDKQKDKEDLFDKPTQVLTIKDGLNSNNKNDCDDLFFQPTQKIVATSDKQKDKEDLFDQPTQVLTIEDGLNSNNENDCDDLFFQPTQKVVSTTSKSKENEHLFDKVTQALAVENNLDDDLFLQPTQQITVASKSKSPLKAFSNNSEKGTSVESQLEVMFASQPLLPQSNSRPTNPLVSILEGNYGIDSEDTESLNLPTLEPINQNEVSAKESLSSKQDEVTTKKQTRSRETVVVKENITVDNKNNLVSNEENKSNKRLRSTRRSSMDNFKLENDKMSTRRSKKIEEQEVKNKQSKNEKECSSGVTLNIIEESTQWNEDNANEITVKESITFKEDEFITRKQTRSTEEFVPKENVTVDDKNNLVSNEEEKSAKQLRSARKLSVDDAKIENDKMSTRRNRRIERSKNEKECSSGVTLKKTERSKQSNEDEVMVKESLFSKEDEVITRKQTRSKEKVVAKENVTVDNKNNLVSNQEERSTKQLRSTRKLSVDDTKVENDKMSTRKSQRTDIIISSKIIEEQEVQLNKPRKTEKKDSSGGSQKKTEDENEISNKNVENERLKVQEDKDGNACQETKINTRKRTTRSGSVDSQNTAKIVKKNKNNETCETTDQTGIIKSSSKLRNLRKDPNKLNDIQDIIGTSKEVVKSDAVKPSTITRSTRGAKKNINCEQPLIDSVMIISSENSDDDIILNKPRISKRKQNSQTSSVGCKEVKTVDTSPESAPIAKKSKINESDTNNANSSSSSLRTPIRSRRLSSVGSINDTPNRNKRKQKPKIVFTMLDSPELESLIRSLGGSVVDTVNACTVLVTGSLKRSQKLLSAVGQAKPICSVKWLQECKKMSTFLDPWDFILEDEEAETKWNFSLKESLIRSQNKKLLENYSILVLVTTAVDVLKAAIESCGGKCVSRAPADTKNFIVVASPENKRKYAKFIKQKVTIVSPEAIFDGVLRQELRFKDHLLS